MSDKIELLFACGLVLATVLFVSWLGQTNLKWIKRILDWFPAILFAYVLPAAVTHALGINLAAVELHEWSKSIIIPFTILTVMSALPLKQLKIVGIKPLVVFFSGSFVIALLPVFLVFVYGLFSEDGSALFLIHGYWKGLVPLVGSWIGGSTSQLVLKELAGTPSSLFLSILVLDNVLVNVWTIFMFQFIKRSDKINQILGIEGKIPLSQPAKLPNPNSTIFQNFVTLGCVGLGMILVYFFPLSFLVSIVLLSLVGMILGNVIPIWNHPLVLKLASFSILTIMAILGLKLDFQNLSLPMSLVILVVIWIVLHFFSMLVVARLLKVNSAWVAIGSMANLGGISTAPAVTSAYKKELMPHAIVLAILSMVTGTSWGILTIYLFEWLLKIAWN